MTIFVQRASDCLTDHLSHGEGLICFALLDGLARRGHRIFAATGHAAIAGPIARNLEVRSLPARSPARSLQQWESSWKADRWLARLRGAGERIDMVWRMNPTGSACPRRPNTGGLPLVLGPLYYEWPTRAVEPAARPRLGFGIGPAISPLARRGWQQTLDEASLIFCATGPHAKQIEGQVPGAIAAELPVIIDPPPMGSTSTSPTCGYQGRPRLVFVANLIASKNPQIFCDIVGRLRGADISAEGTVIGEGPLRRELENYCARSGIGSAVRFVGRLPNLDIFEHLRNADFLVSTSLGEPYGRNIAEAMSVGTPCVCHRSGGPADIIADGRDGLLVNELNAKSFAARIAEAWHHQGYVGALGRAAGDKAKEWSASVVLDRVETRLSELLPRQPGQLQAIPA